MIALALFGIVAAIILLFLLGAIRAASAADDRDERLIADIQAMHAECPWPLSAPFHANRISDRTPQDHV